MGQYKERRLGDIARLVEELVLSPGSGRVVSSLHLVVSTEFRQDCTVPSTCITTSGRPPTPVIRLNRPYPCTSSSLSSRPASSCTSRPG